MSCLAVTFTTLKINVPDRAYFPLSSEPKKRTKKIREDDRLAITTRKPLQRSDINSQIHRSKRRNNYRSSTLERREKEEEIKVTRVEKVEGKGK